MRGLVVNVFLFLKLNLFCFVVAILDLVHDVETVQGLSLLLTVYEPRSEKTGLWGFRPGPTQTRLHNYRRLLET